MTYRALFTGDIHAGNNLPWAVKDPTTLVTDRLRDIMEVLQQMSGYALEHEIQDIWILGDLIDRRLVDAVTLKAVAEELLSLRELELSDGRKLRVFLIPGNHEAGDAACKHFTLDAFASMGFWVAGQHGEQQISLIEPVDGFEVVAMPYLPAARAIQLLESTTAHLPTLLLIHQTIKGGMVGGWVSPDGLEPSLLESVATHTLSAHFHSPQTIGKHVHYLGAPVQHSFSDCADERGYWDIEFTGKFAKRTKVPVVGAPTFHEKVIHCASGLTSTDFPDLSEIPAKSYVNLKVTGAEAEVEKRWISVQEWCDKARKETGARLIKPTPIYTAQAARSRITMSDTTERPTWDKVLSSYLDTADCTGLNRAKLESLAKELLIDGEK